nr:tetratricopeptide repeat protein [Fodinibius sp.]NIV13488.1 tetratricopeptide repeat protein [Fodinibius sp.]NIY27258.1 tetratricopeptide repeat protein [Fodinibius sp.]
NEGSQEKNKKKVSADNVDDIVSKTLAQIHERQGKLDAAIRTYERLIELRPNQREQYQEEIIRLKAKKGQGSNEEE